jgi:predicted Zn-dependent protease
LVTDPKQEDRLNALTERIRKLLPYGNERLDVKIIGAFKDPDPNAYDGLDRNVVTTGRTIYFGKDYLAHKPTDDELLFIIGHETAHAQRDHNYLYDKLFQPEVKDLDGLLRGGKIDLPQDRVQLYMDIRLHRLNYEQETQADRLGAAMAQGAGAKPEGIRDAFQWMAKEEAFMSKLPEYARTHPKPLDRYEALRKIWGPVWGGMK